MSPAEAAWLMAGSVLELLEIGGPDAVREQLEELPRSQREEVVRAAERGVELVPVRFAEDEHVDVPDWPPPRLSVHYQKNILQFTDN